VAVEALVRWAHPHLGAIPPHECLAAAGRGRLVAGLTDAVLAAVAADRARWAGFPEAAGLGTCVNLSAAQLVDPGLLERLGAVLDLTGRAPGTSEPSLAVEITEPGALQDLDTVAQRLTAVRELGCGVILDGFGAGYCALAPLTVLPIDLVKIDLSAVRDLDRFERLVAAVRAVTLGRGVRTVAEGVETPEQWDAARRAGCDLIQGFVLCPPVPASQVLSALRSGLRGVGHQRHGGQGALSEPPGRSG
jgi:EAL domain-containing protein (putative c-di-GMP-specific phosphodiesterase class I)